MMTHTLSDAYGALTVRMMGDTVDSVVVRNRWRDHYDAEALSRSLSQLIRDGLPNPDADATADSTSNVPPVITDEPMTTTQFDGFWNEFALMQRKMQLRRERVQSEHEQWSPPKPLVDARRRVGVDFDATGRFASIALAPDWLEHASMQQITDTVSDFLRDVPLDQRRPAHPLDAEITRHRTNARRYLAA